MQLRRLLPAGVILAALSIGVLTAGAVPGEVSIGVSEDPNVMRDGEIITGLVVFEGVVAPGVPTDLSAVAGDAQIILSWTPPTDDGGAPINSYFVKWYSDLESVTRATNGSVNTSSPSSPYTMTGLTNGVTYMVSISAVNAVTTGPASEVVSVTPFRVPSAPMGLTGSIAGGIVTLVWLEPLNSGGATVTGYRIERQLGGDGLWAVAVSDTGSGSTQYALLGLAEGVSYDFRVAALNSAGVGPMSNRWSTTVEIGTSATTTVPSGSSATTTVLPAGSATTTVPSGSSATTTVLPAGSATTTTMVPPTPCSTVPPPTTSAPAVTTSLSVPDDFPVLDQRIPLTPLYVC